MHENPGRTQDSGVAAANVPRWGGGGLKSGCNMRADKGSRLARVTTQGVQKWPEPAFRAATEHSASPEVPEEILRNHVGGLHSGPVQVL